MERKRNYALWIVILLVLAGIYLTFFYKQPCSNEACWEERLRDCKRTKFVNNDVDVIWEYKVNGKTQDKCEVTVEAISIKRGLKKSEILEDKKMVCLRPIGSIPKPESDPNLCTGPLKEAMQELIIQKLHEYIVQNVGEIGSEAIEVISSSDEEDFGDGLEESNSTG